MGSKSVNEEILDAETERVCFAPGAARCESGTLYRVLGRDSAGVLRYMRVESIDKCPEGVEIIVSVR